MASFVRITVLLWADVLAWYAMWMMMTYLTTVWKLSLTHAARIVNIWRGITTIMPIGFAFLVDALMGNYSMLLLSSISYSIGLGFLFMSTPSILFNSTGTCSQYRPECIGHTQKVLFYTALALIAVGRSGRLVSLESFLDEQNPSLDEQNQNKTGGAKKKCGSKFLCQTVILFSVILVAVIAFPYIKAWAIMFGIPAICTLVATLLFLSGSWSYKYNSPKGSPLTTVFRVFVASASKIFQRLPDDPNQLYPKGNPDSNSRHTPDLRCLDKAAVILKTKPLEDQENNRWTLCRVSEVEETKIGIRMVPMCITFITCGIVLSIGNTYFLVQGNHMNRKVGHLDDALPFFLVLYNFSKSLCATLYACLAKCLDKSGLKRYAHPIGIAVAMIFSILCCITAAKVETRRIDVIRSHGLLDKPEEKIPMSIFVLLPQYLLLAALDRVSEISIAGFFNDQAPSSMKKYLVFFAKGVFGVGILGSALSVYIVGKVSEMGGKPNWFQYTLNKSRLDKYYWTLAALSAVNLVLYIVVACLYYSWRESELEDAEALGAGESAGAL